MKTLIIAEKFDMAKDKFRPMLERMEKETFVQKDGFFESKKFNITWCIGHVLELAQPDKYGWKEWTLNSLPMIPQKWESVMVSSKAKQATKVVKLCQEAAMIINAGDPGREGELIVREIVNEAKCGSKLKKRLWSSTTTNEGLNEAWKNLKNSSDYDGYYHSALARSHSDWLVGMNFSRLYALKSGTQGLSVGRVQTPTLKIICDRDSQIKNWKRSFFHEAHGIWKNIDLTYQDSNEIKQFEQNTIPLKIKSACEGKQATCISSKESEKSIEPPRPFSLSSLTVEANKKFGFSAKETLEIAQKLYENGVITYPRTDSEYLPEDMVNDAWAIIGKLASIEDKSHLRDQKRKSSVFNSSKVSDHYAIIPTNKIEPLQNDLEKIYNLIKERFIQAFMLENKFIQYEITVNCEGHIFRGCAYYELQKGWKINVDEAKGCNWMENKISIKEKDLGKITSVEVVQKERTKPKHYNDGSIIVAMNTAGREIEDEAMLEAMKNKGLGTSATQAAIIETLLQRGYIERTKKNLQATEKGYALIEMVDPKLSSPELTGEWEYKLANMEKKEMTFTAFETEIADFVKSNINNFKNNPEMAKAEKLQKNCPKCQGLLKTNDYGIFCEDKEKCDFKMWRNCFGKILNDREIDQLLNKGETLEKVTGLKKYDSKKKSFSGEKYDAKLYFIDGKIQLKICDEATKKETSHICPKCQSHLVSNESGYTCQKKCGFKISKIICSKNINDELVMQIVSEKSTKPISGFISKKGNPFTAKLVLDEAFQVQFAFD